jgi:hypothetical protein
VKLNDIDGYHHSRYGDSAEGHWSGPEEVNVCSVLAVGLRRFMTLLLGIRRLEANSVTHC